MDEQKNSSQKSAKKEFVEPQVSAPVDVLEATAFFQVILPGPSGNSNNGNNTIP